MGTETPSRAFQFLRSVSIISEHDSDFEDLPEFPCEDRTSDTGDGHISALDQHAPEGTGQGNYLVSIQVCLSFC